MLGWWWTERAGGDACAEQQGGREGKFMRLNNPLNREGAFVRWSGERSILRVYMAVKLELTA